ncbi:MAG: metallophosphoesterase family protein [Planctomycetota bacterium]
MRVLAIGDIHGCSAALDALLEAVQPGPDDQVIPLGDYVDRGPDSKGVIERLIALQGATNLIPLLGNHDQMMLDARSGDADKLWWIDDYGRKTLASYATPFERGSLETVPPEHWTFLAGCRDLLETDTHVFVHANLYPDLELADQPVFMTRWESLSADLSAAHCSGKTMVCGHTSQKSGRPLDLGHAVCIDTYAHGGGWLSCLDASSGRLWQASQAGELWTGWLHERC